jgi:hypothetical protein
LAQTIYPSQRQSAPQKHRIQLPSGWKVFQGERGLIVLHPAGWQIQERPNGAFLAYRPGPEGGATAVVLAEPIQQIEGPAMGVVQGVGQIFPDLFPAVQISKSRLVSREPEVAVAEMRYAPGGGSFRGIVMCFKQDQKGVMYAIAATLPLWPQEEPVMKRMLSSFFYTGRAPSGDQEKGAIPSLPGLVSWRDPLEGAFTCPVPQGWTVEGGLRRFTAIDVRPEVLATSPDNTITIRIGDSFVPPMCLPSQTMESFGFYEGSWYSPNGVDRQLVMRYLPATRFLTDLYLPERIGPIRKVQAREFPELSQRTQVLWARAGIQAGVDTGEVTFEAQTEAGDRKGYAFAQTVVTLIPGVPDRGNWYVTVLNGYLSVPGAASIAETLLNRMAAGYRTDPNWAAQQARTTAAVSKIWSDTGNQIADMIHQTFQERSRVQDRTQERWSRTFRGEVLIQDPDTGEQFEVPAGSNYYWRVDTGEAFIGTEAPTSPHLPNHWIREMRVLDE